MHPLLYDSAPNFSWALHNLHNLHANCIKGELRLPEEKLHRLQLLLSEWGDRKACTRKDLESLIGHLNHACKVVRSGRSFLRRMIDLLHTRRYPAAARRTPVFASTPVSEPTLPGGRLLRANGTASLFSRILISYRCSRWPPTLRAPGAAGLSQIRGGSRSSGQLRHSRFQLR